VDHRTDLLIQKATLKIELPYLIGGFADQTAEAEG
jgi:hypothetical protein